MYSLSVKLYSPNLRCWPRLFGASTRPEQCGSLAHANLAVVIISYFSLSSGKQVVFGISSNKSWETEKNKEKYVEMV